MATWVGRATGRALVALWVPLGASACGAPGDTDPNETGTIASETEADDSSAQTSTSEPGSTGSVETCSEDSLPLCAVCPDSMAFYCGLPCAAEGDGCSAPDGEGMECYQGRWQCFVHPPVVEGCEALCVAGQGCGSESCEDSLAATFTPEGSLAVGHYVVSFAVDGRSGSCEGDISDDPVSCANEIPCLLGSTCRELSLQPAAAAPRLVLELDVGSILSLQVAIDDVVVLDEEGAPAYDVVDPNGPGCGPTCAAGLVELPI